MKRRTWLFVVAVCLSVLFQAGSLGAALYHYQDLTLQGLTLSSGNDNINAINDSGWIVGAYYPAGAYQAFVWRPGVGRTTLQKDPNSPAYDSIAYGINNQGQIVGTAPFAGNASLLACWWSNPSAIAAKLPPINVLKAGCAYGINEQGQIVGASCNASGWGHACLWSDPTKVPTDLGTLGGNTSSGRSINNAGQVAGIADKKDVDGVSYSVPCIWEPGYSGYSAGDLALSLRFPSIASVINSRGNVVGQAWGGGMFPQAFFWDHQTGVLRYPSGTIGNPSAGSTAGGLSDADMIAGWDMTLFCWSWTPSGGKKDLNKLVVNLPNGVALRTVSAVSRRGLIAGFDSQGHPFLLTPLAPLAGVDLLLMD